MIQIKSNVKQSFALLLLLTVLFACEKNDRLEKFQNKISGKYEIVSATADQEVDIDLDGSKDTNVLSEIPELQYSYLELIIREYSTTFVFSQFWQNQYFIGVEGRPIQYDPSIGANFMNQATVAKFEIAHDRKTLILSRETDDPAYPLPYSVQIQSDDTIKIAMPKEVFTTSGWVTVTLEVIYKKTSETV